MSWLTIKAIELDRAEALARRQADLEEAVGRALWRMDVKMMPHLAREAARPYGAYSPLMTAAGATTNDWTSALLSPLLTDRSEFVLVNYQVEPGDIWSSPQAPTDTIRTFACASGVSPDLMTSCSSALSELQAVVSYDKLDECLPLDPDISNDRYGNPKLISNSIVSLDQVAQVEEVEQIQSQQRVVPQANRGYSRGGPSNDYENRDAAMNRYAQQAAVEQVLNYNTRNFNNPAAAVATADLETAGVSQPIWVGDQLLLARRAGVGERVVIQGCWLDWGEIKTALIDEVSDVLPGVSLEPVADPSQAQVGRMLATLPVQIVTNVPVDGAVTWTAMQVSLLVAWVSVVVAAIAAGILLHGVLTLSERRGAFVSAVTHELRTPLTTFRMYSEMLASDMVPDQTKRQKYLDTLRVEADRLSHLVENVLSYAKLERGPQRQNREELSVDAILERSGERLVERAQQAEMAFVTEGRKEFGGAVFKTDPAAVEQILFNLVDNACKYAGHATDRRIHLVCEADATSVRFCVRDHGGGIAPREVKSLFQPFSKSADEAAHSAPGVGLGLALCRRLAHDLGGRLEWLPSDDGGAAFQLTLPR